MLLLDAEKDCPAKLGPRLFAAVKRAQSNAVIACVLAARMFENWIVAGSGILSRVNGLPNPLPQVVNVESMVGKAWLEQQLRSVDKARAYSESIDYPEFVRAMDMAASRQSAPSFDKLCRELEKLIPPAASPDPNPPVQTAE